MTLDVINIGDTEQAVYESIIAYQPIGLAELDAALAGRAIHPERLGPTVERLRQMGLVTSPPHRPDQLIAAPPNIALEALLINKEEQLRHARLLAAKLTKMHYESTIASGASPVAEVVTGVETVILKCEQVQLAAREELLVIDRPPHAENDPFLRLSLEHELANRGVRSRRIFDPHGLSVLHAITEEPVQIPAVCGDARVLPETPLKLIIADDELAVIPLQFSAETIESAVVVQPSALIVGLCALFEQLWERALPVSLTGPEGPATLDDPTPDERRLLDLLTSGVSDDQIAEHVGISHRTLQRRLRALMQRLGSRTRFQAALRALSLGWVPVPQLDALEVSAPEDCS